MGATIHVIKNANYFDFKGQERPPLIVNIKTGKAMPILFEWLECFNYKIETVIGATLQTQHQLN